MKKEVSHKQALELMAKLQANTDWNELDADMIRQIIMDPIPFGREFTRFLQNGGQTIGGESRIISIDRTAPFNPS